MSEHAPTERELALERENAELRAELAQRRPDFSRDFEQLLEQTGDHIYAKDLEFRFRFASQTVARATGRAHWRDLVGTRDEDVFPASHMAAYRAEDEAVIRTGRPIVGQIDPFSNAAGDEVFVETSKWPQFDRTGRLVGVMGISRDVTERELLARRIRASEARYRSLVAIAADGIHLLDASGHLIEANDAFLRSLGYTQADVPNLTVFDWDASIAPDALPFRIADLLNSTATFETRHRRKDGTVFDVEVSAGAVHLDGHTYLLAFSRDTSARKEAERRLRDLLDHLEQRVGEEVARAMAGERALLAQSRLAALGEMLGNIAHQWRQPLNTLAWLHANLADVSRTGALTPRLVEEMNTEASQLIQQMSTTISDFMDFFRPGKAPVRFDVRKQVNEAVALVSASLRHQRIAVHVELGDAPFIIGFPNEYAQVLINLLTNARDAIVDRQRVDGLIELRLDTVGRTCRLTVSDNGGGIPPEALGRIFDPYYTTKSGGTGIGLYMSKMLVEQSMNGTIAAENYQDGARVTIVAPLADDIA